MQDKKKAKSTQNTEPEEPPKNVPMCTCFQDPFADLPAELRPKPVEKPGGLRKVTCPDCGLEYRTNRKTAVCIECGKKPARRPEKIEDPGWWMA